MARAPRIPLPIAGAGQYALDRKSAHYLSEVLRLAPGSAFVAFDPEARLEADATLLAIGRDARYALAEPRESARAHGSGIVLVQALGKGDKLEQVVRHATALGVSALHVVESERSVARSGERAEARRTRWRACSLDAARQSGRADLPLIVGPQSLEQELEQTLQRPGLKLCLAPGAERTLRTVASGWRTGEPLELLIGPEGGFDPRELERARQAGFQMVRFGELVLRTELAGIAALAALGVLGEA